MQEFYNDWQGNYGSGGTNLFQNLYADFVDTAHDESPGSKIICQSGIPTGTGLPASNFTQNQYSNSIWTVASARPNYCAFINGFNLMSLADLGGDQIHPSDSGNIKFAQGIVNALWTNAIVPDGFSPKAISNLNTTAMSLTNAANTFTGTFTGNGYASFATNRTLVPVVATGITNTLGVTGYLPITAATGLVRYDCKSNVVSTATTVTSQYDVILQPGGWATWTTVTTNGQFHAW